MTYGEVSLVLPDKGPFKYDLNFFLTVFHPLPYPHTFMTFYIVILTFFEKSMMKSQKKHSQHKDTTIITCSHYQPHP